MYAGSLIKRPNDADAEIAKRVRDRRVAKGMSQTELGRAIGVTFQQVQKYENGTNRIGSGRLTRIAAALDVPISVLFGGGKKQRHSPSPLDDMAVEGADRLLRAYQRLSDRGSRVALLHITEHLAKR